jgi:hypothetical protein
MLLDLSSGSDRATSQFGTPLKNLKIRQLSDCLPGRNRQISDAPFM